MAEMQEGPETERARLAALHDLGILDTAEEVAFDRMTRLAAAIFGAPIALVSLIDGERQWFKSRVGIEACETSREVSFCAHALGASEPLVIQDAREDHRFNENPNVVGPPYIRFYAGAQLTTSNGFDLGTLCVVDTEPRPAPRPEKLDLLRDLAATATLLIEQRRVMIDYASEVEARGQAEEQMRVSRDEAKAAAAEMRALFSRVSHDLRTPLTAILGFSELLTGSSLTAEQAEDLEQVRKGARDLLVMVDSLLKVARDHQDGS